MAFLFPHFFKNKFIYLFLSVLGLRFCERAFFSCSEGGHSSSRCVGLSLSRPLLLWSTGSRCAGSVVVAHGPSCSTTCGIFPDKGSNPCPLHWQVDSQPLHHQGSPGLFINIGHCHLFPGLPHQPSTLFPYLCCLLSPTQSLHIIQSDLFSILIIKTLQ